ncbi:hypothetical protein CEXT_622681 [Caerostris extrusa]|uniref:Uncharacterized protein n=1 Tax=Caerostris extrusa TaxID=172846 RepID=A0AAV4N4Q9_CAEEX|nr:hypothetical protein CEXT_622681 [Caerostris extrusa]
MYYLPGNPCPGNSRCVSSAGSNVLFAWKPMPETADVWSSAGSNVLFAWKPMPRKQQMYTLSELAERDEKNKNVEIEETDESRKGNKNPQ